jgi:hypothetical protein
MGAMAVSPWTQDTGSVAFGELETRQPLTRAQIDGIARELLARLSLEEKIDMMSGGHLFFPGMFHFSSGARRHSLDDRALRADSAMA